MERQLEPFQVMYGFRQLRVDPMYSFSFAFVDMARCVSVFPSSSSPVRMGRNGFYVIWKWVHDSW